MSKELKTKMTDHTITEFWGGVERGNCAQITASCKFKLCDNIEAQLQEEGHVKLTMEDAAALCNDLGQFIKREATRRQGLLKAEIAAHRSIEKIVFNEVAELPENLMAGPEIAVNMVSKFCPKV